MTQLTNSGQQRGNRLSGGVSIMKVFALLPILVCVELSVVSGLQSSVLADLKQVKRASASGISNKDTPNIPVPDVQNTLDKDEVEEPIAMASIEPMPSYSQLPATRGRFFYDRPADVYDADVYEDRHKRNAMKGRPMKRSARIFRSFSDDGSRAKRESQLSQVDPEELLSLLAMWEEEQQQRHKFPSNWRSSQRNGHEYDPYTSEIINDIEGEDGDENEEWLDGPVQHRFTVKPRFYPPYNNNLIPNRQARKYKSSPDNEYARILSQLSGNNGRLDQHALLQRRYLL